MTKRSTQVVGYRISESFQLLIYGFEVRRASRQFLVESLNLLTPVFALGDITDRTRNQRALLRLQRTEADLHRKLSPVFPPSVQLQTLTHRPQSRLGEELHAVFGMPGSKPFRHQNLNLLPQKLLALVAKQLLHLGIDQYDLALPIHHDHRIGSGFQKPAEFLLGLLALGDITDRTRNQRALFRLQRTESDLHRKLRPVFPPSVQLKTLTHRPHPRLGKELPAVIRMPADKPVRHHMLNHLPQNLLPLEAKHPLHHTIPYTTLSPSIHHDHRIGSRFQKPTEFLLSLLALGDITDRTG